MGTIPQDILDSILAVRERKQTVSDRVEEHFCPIIPISDYDKLVKQR